MNLTLGKSVTARSGLSDEFPACFPDINGQVYLRGHLTLSPVPATGGSLLAIFPRDSKGECSCTPRPDAGTMSNDVIATTTAIAYPNDRPNIPDVCIVRLFISQSVAVDVNQDLVVNEQDIFLVENSTYYSFDLLASSQCPIVDSQRICGREDVNFDGLVNQLDSTAISQSAYVLAGTGVPCGGVTATTFSCGSSRRAPLTPAVDISFDSIVYFNNDGEYAPTGTLKRSVAAADSALLRTILVDYEHIHSKIDALELENAALKSENVALSNRVDSVDSGFKHLDSRVDGVDSEVRRHGHVLRAALPADRRHVIAAVSAAVAAALLCGAVALFIARRR